MPLEHSPKKVDTTKVQTNETPGVSIQPQETNPIPPTDPRNSDLNNESQDSDSSSVNSAETLFQNNTMPIGNSQIVSLKDAVEVVVKFDGTNIPVYQFIDSCEEALVMLPSNVEQNLVRLIRTKITGEAKRSIQGMKFENLKQLTKHLKELFSPARTVNQVRRELGTVIQKDKEDVITFINRVREIGNHILEAYKSNNAGEVSEEEKASTEQECIESFLDGLKPEIQLKMKTTYATLNEAGTDAIKIDRKQRAINELRKGQREDKPAPRRESVGTISKSPIICQICKRQGHGADTCWHRNQNIASSRDREKPPAQNKQSQDQTQKANIEEKFCRYCKRKGHVIEECRKREYNNKRKAQGNSNSLPNNGANSETPNKPAPRKTLVVNQPSAGEESE